MHGNRYQIKRLSEEEKVGVRKISKESQLRDNGW